MVSNLTFIVLFYQQFGHYNSTFHSGIKLFYQVQLNAVRFLNIPLYNTILNKTSKSNVNNVSFTKLNKAPKSYVNKANPKKVTKTIHISMLYGNLWWWVVIWWLEVWWVMAWPLVVWWIIVQSLVVWSLVVRWHEVWWVVVWSLVVWWVVVWWVIVQSLVVRWDVFIISYPSQEDTEVDFFLHIASMSDFVTF